MTTIVNLVLIVALVATLVVALEHNHTRNGRPRVAGFTGRIGALPLDRPATAGRSGRDLPSESTRDTPLFQ